MLSLSGLLLFFYPLPLVITFFVGSEEEENSVYKREYNTIQMNISKIQCIFFKKGISIVKYVVINMQSCRFYFAGVGYSLYP